MWRRRYASVVVLLLTCLINRCCLTLIGRRRVKSQLIVLFLSPGPSLPFSLFLSAVQNRDATSFSDKLKAIDSLLLTTKNQYPFHRNCINWVVLFFPQEVRRPFIILCLPMMNLLTTKTTFLRHEGKCIRQGARR